MNVQSKHIKNDTLHVLELFRENLNYFYNLIHIWFINIHKFSRNYDFRLKSRLSIEYNTFYSLKEWKPNRSYRNQTTIAEIKHN